MAVWGGGGGRGEGEGCVRGLRSSIGGHRGCDGSD